MSPHQHTLGPVVIPKNIGYRVSRKTVDSDYAIDGSDQYVSAIDALTFTLPAARSVPSGWQVVLANSTPGDSTVNAMPLGADTINGVAGGASIEGVQVFVSDGVDNWETSSQIGPKGDGPLNVLRPQFAGGADPTGVKDSQPAIQAAIDSVPAHGGTVFVPAGTYLIKSPIRFTQDKAITIYGESNVNCADATNVGTKLVLADNADCDMIVKEVGARADIRGLFLEGNKANQVATDLHGIWFKGDLAGIYRGTIEDCLIWNISGTGVQIDGFEARLYKVGCSYNTGCGIIVNAPSDVEMEDILSGFNGEDGMLYNGANSHRVVRGDFYRNKRGLHMVSSSNNVFVGITCDANEEEGLLIDGSAAYSYRNTFLQASFNENNYPFDHLGNPTVIPSGTYSNVKLTGNYAVENNWHGCLFFSAEYQHPTSVPKYEFEDGRAAYVGTEGSLCGFFGCSFRDTSFGLQIFCTNGPYHSNLVHNAIGSWLMNQQAFYRDELTLENARVNNLLEASVGMLNNVYYDGAFKYRRDGPGFYLSARYDQPVINLEYAPSGTAGNVATLTSALNINSVNGYVGIANGSTPAVLPLEVNGAVKASIFESNDGLQFNAYYSGGWKRRNDGYAWYLAASSGSSPLVLFVADTGLANSAITWTVAYTVDQTGLMTIGGVLLFPNNTAFYGRNQTNSGNVPMAMVDTANQLRLAVSGTTTVVAGPLNVLEGATSTTIQTAKPLQVYSGAGHGILAVASNTVYSNLGTSGIMGINLPVPDTTKALVYTFVVTDATGIKINPSASATIQIAGNVSLTGTGGGYIQSTTLGDSITLTSLSATTWFATAMVGAGWSTH